MSAYNEPNDWQPQITERKEGGNYFPGPPCEKGTLEKEEGGNRTKLPPHQAN